MVVRAERVDFNRRIALLGLDADAPLAAAPLRAIFVKFQYLLRY